MTPDFRIGGPLYTYSGWTARPAEKLNIRAAWRPTQRSRSVPRADSSLQAVDQGTVIGPSTHSFA